MLGIPACLLLWHAPVQNLGQRSTTADQPGLHPVEFIVCPRMEMPQFLWAEVCDHLDSVKGISYIVNIGNISLRHFFFRSQLFQLTIVCQMILIIVVGLCWTALVCSCLVLESPALTGLCSPGLASAVLRGLLQPAGSASPNAAKDTVGLLDLVAVLKGLWNTAWWPVRRG